MAAVTLDLESAPDAVWHVLGAAWGDVHRIIPSLSASRLTTAGPLGVGAARECTLAQPIMGMTQIRETLTAWDEGRSFTYVTRDAPWPVASVANTWTVEAAPNRSGSRVTLSPQLTLRGGRWTRWLAPAMLAFMARSLAGDVPAMAALIDRAAADVKPR